MSITEPKVRPAWSATDKQRNWLRDICKTHEMSQDEIDVVLIVIERDDFTKVDASAMLDKFLKYTKKPKFPAYPAGGATTNVKDASAPKVRVSPLADLPDTRFAIPVADLSPATRAHAGNGDFLFGEMKSYKGWRYMNVLKGSHPVFTRTKIKYAPADEIAALLRKDLLGYVRHYGEEYKCCSSCGAELTDGTSQRLLLGPECRKKFGL